MWLGLGAHPNRNCNIYGAFALDAALGSLFEEFVRFIKVRDKCLYSFTYPLKGDLDNGRTNATSSTVSRTW